MTLEINLVALETTDELFSLGCSSIEDALTQSTAFLKDHPTQKMHIRISIEHNNEILDFIHNL